MSKDEEKGSSASSRENVNHVDDVTTTIPTSNDIDVDEVYTYKEQRKIIHRVDLRLVLTCGIGYCISLMDRTNTAMAVVAGMKQDLQLGVGFRYSIVILVFFPTYIAFQPFATASIRKIGPRLFISAIVFSWGIILIGMGFVKNWQELAGLRVLLGLLEAGYFPGCVYLLSTWYSRHEVQKRYSLFYFLGQVASSLSGILAFGLMQMDGIHNIAGWSWIFILEGVISIAIAIVCGIFLVDFPDKATNAWGFLSQKEADFVIRRLNRDRSDTSVEPFSMKRFCRPALDLKVWGFGLIFFCLTTVTYAISYFLPIILAEGMGFDTGTSQCLVAPPYFFAAILMFVTSWWGDKYRLRGPVLVFNAMVGLIGLPLMGFAKGNAARYAGVFLTTAGANANVPAALAYQANNIRGQWKRAFASASLVGLGGVGGIAGSLVFRSQDAPGYIPGIWAAIA
ncbi:hypothetical protein FQN57_001365 [Myotisia sp. PD_48]|nr:hypothetical protein FQN57_001365 [Myotisia sp. PD_48]